MKREFLSVFKSAFHGLYIDTFDPYMQQEGSLLKDMEKYGKTDIFLGGYGWIRDVPHRHL